MSFTSIVKNEVSKVEMLDSEKKSELIAILTNIGTFTNKLNITTENASVARRVFTLIKDNYRFTPKVTVRKGYNFTKNYLYIIECPFTNEIKDDFNLILSNKIPEEYLVDDEEAIKAYLRGLFLAVGSINDPKKSRYHLEFLVDNKEYANFISKLLNTFSLNSKVLIREDTKVMIYVKEAEKISDFLRIISAISAILYFEDIRIYRDHKNMTNRLNNCEQANVDKIIQTANDQLKDIQTITRVGGLDLLDDKLKEAAIYREKYQDASLLELSEIISIETNKKITKS
jgi:cell division protein WhiA